MTHFSDTEWLRLTRYFAGDATPAEAAALERWMAESSENARRVAALRQSWEARGPRTFAGDSEVLWDSLQAMIRAEGAASRATSQPAPHRRSVSAGRVGTRPLSRWLAGAAVVAAGCIAVVIFRQASATTDVRGVANEPHYATGVGQRATVILDDGTRATLAPRTTLRVATDFNRGTRTVFLSGEAIFDVTRHSDRPFIVRTGAVATRVLGTVFDVQRYPGEAVTRVAVVSGKVIVTAATPRHPSLTLVATAVGDVTDSTAVVRSGDDATEAVRWTAGRLVFRDTPTREVLAAITRWYGYEFRLADSVLANEKLTAWVSTESSHDALATLKAVLNADLTFDGNVVTLHAKRTTSETSPATRRQRFLPSPTPEVGR